MQSLQQKRIGLIAFPAVQGARMAGALEQMGAASSNVDVNTVRPGASELERYDALLLHVDDEAEEFDWLRPEFLRQNTRPLLLAGQPEVLQRHFCLQTHADDVIVLPLALNELELRLCRLTAWTGERRHAVAPSRKPCVLVADDDPDIVMYLKHVFRGVDVEAYYVSDGGAALEAARRLLPDLLMLDIGMPVMNGIDVLRALRSDPNTSALVTVLLTGSSDPLHAESCAALGAVDYILKPFPPFYVTHKVKALLGLQYEYHRNLGIYDVSDGVRE